MSYRKLGRTSSQRKAMLRDLTTDLLINERIVTTEARAKEVPPSSSLCAQRNCECRRTRRQCDCKVRVTKTVQ